MPCIYLLGLLFIPSAMALQNILKKASDHQIYGFKKEDEGRWNGPYVFVHGADPQFGFIDKIKGGGGKKWDEEMRLFREGISAINDMSPRPRFFFISGDLVDAFPGEEPFKCEQTRDFLSILAESQVPVMVISGNHDIGNSPTTSSVSKYRETFGDDYYSFYVGGVMFIALNSQYFYDSSNASELAEEQMAWLDQQLQSAKSDADLRHIVVFMHIPLFLFDSEEEDQYFSIPMPLRKTLLEKFGDAGVSTVFSGHYHRNAGGVWRKKIGSKDIKVEIVVTSAIGAQLGKDKSGLSVVRVQEDSITQQYYAMERIPLS